MLRSLVIALVIALVGGLPAAAIPAAAQQTDGSGTPGAAQRKGSSTGLRVPRFVSLKSDAVNVRVGPSRQHAIVWRYVRSGMPVEVTQEFDNWRRIRDFEGAEGWVFHSLLSGVRSALVSPWDTNATPVPIRRDARLDSPVVTRLEPGVQGRVDTCDGQWCHLEGDQFEGWIEQDALWGVYPGEIFD
ncbi:SH3 domain-containing protein [Methylobrevis pamukkalensis]|uniref:Bacterial SH3 domain protein n=1 Tax=Methylobrevis pamukkalensis TaxID=1439726 RepID=A0A1E3H703_9HYPH|nr:SH3 domain-containing protein [Methylobrevis pamukkalensis]ODN72100.1 Bacterial SH3 domain protein [Methylobrevis pamukkalensis]